MTYEFFNESKETLTFHLYVEVLSLFLSKNWLSQ